MSADRATGWEDPKGTNRGKERKPPAELVDEVQASPAGQPGCPVLALDVLPEHGGIIALVGSVRVEDGAPRSTPQAWRVEFDGTDGGTSSSGGGYFRLVRGESSLGCAPSTPDLPPSATRACIATHRSQLKFSAVAVGVSNPGGVSNGSSPNGGLDGRRDAPAPPFTVFLSEGSGAVPAGFGDGACELAAVRGVDVAATTSQTPPARHPEVYALGGDAVWAIDLAAGPSGKFKTRVPVAGTPDANRHGTDGGGRGESRYGSPDGGRGGSNRHARRLEHSTAASAFLIASGPAASGSSSSSNSSSNVHSSGVPCDRISAWKEGIPSPCVHEGRAATFVGADDACFSVLSVDGRELSLYANDAPRSRMAHYKLDRSCDLVFRGPSPNAVAFSSIGDVATNKPGIFGLLHNAEGRGKCMRGWLPLKPGERVRRAFFQKIDELAASSSSSDETHGKPTGAVAILTDQSRLVLAEWHGSGEKGEPCVMTALTETPKDRRVSSCAWVGPALLFTEANGSIGVLTWHDDDRTSDNVGHGSGSGSVLSLCGGGLGAGASDGGALLTFTEDAAVLLHATGDSPPAPPASSSRPIAFMDALCVAWGSMCDSRTTRGLPAPVDAARRAVATAAGRYDASRVSERALDAIGRSLALPGLASNVGARATHLGVGARARVAARAYRASAAVESARLSQNQAADLTVPPERLAFATPASCEVAPDVAAAMRDAAEAAAFIGDARAAFDAAALAVGATGGKDVSALVRLCERGVAAADGSGGFAIIEAAVRQKLADGSAVKNACVEALARRRAPTLPPPDGIEQPAGFEVQLGSMAASASTSATGREAGVAAGMGKEVSRASTLTHSDWLGRRVRDTGNGAGGVEGDGSDPGVRSNRAGVGGGDGWGTSPPASNPTSPSRGPNPTGGVNFRPAAPVQPELQTRAQTATPPSFAPIAQQQHTAAADLRLRGVSTLEPTTGVHRRAGADDSRLGSVSKPSSRKRKRSLDQPGEPVRAVTRRRCASPGRRPVH